ncbi:fasciclin-like arabinogalactan protein 7 [Miscanthus floridulus]|uniref:fasciclin-like arabinogalactan protein 7 n=1 Tax=Miscanthus floridulus TaxID=154761 RepID=UPI00345A2538
MEPKSAVLAIAMLCLALPRATLSQRTSSRVVETPAPAPALHHVNLTELLALAGPYGTFLDYLTRTDVIRTFQSQANATTDHDHDQGGVTVFAPQDSAFAAVDGAALSNLTADQLRTLMLCHGVPRYLPLSSFAALAASGPVPTFAGGVPGCALNVTDAAGRIHVTSGWTRAARLVSSVYSTPPVAVYALDRVLLPEQVFPTEPAVAPVPAPAAGGGDATDAVPAATERGDSNSSSCRFGARRVLVGYLALMSFGFLLM